MCANSNCISEELKCDGWNDCGDNSDEKNCSKYSQALCYEEHYKVSKTLVD